MRKFTISFCLCLLLVTTSLMAQENTFAPVQRDKTSLGFGGGFDFGGFGANLLIYPAKNLGLFVGAGYALAGAGVNAGVKYRLVSVKGHSKLDPYFVGMYGYNAVVKVANMTQYNKFFYGPSVGFGFDFQSNPLGKGYWSAALLIPFRSAEVNDYIDDLKSNHGIEFKNGLIPVGFSIGYRIIL